MNNNFNFEEIISKVTSALIYSNTPLWESQYVPAIELILRLDERGIPITHLVCSGELNSCPANPFHELVKCATCKKITNQAKKKLIPANVKVEELLNTFWYCVPYFESQMSFRQFEYQSLPAGQLAYSQLVDDASDLEIPLSIINQRGRNLISEAINLYEQSLKIITRDSIQTVFVWNGRRSSDGPALFAARQLGLKAYSFSSGSTPDKFYFQENSLHSIEEWNRSISSFAAHFSGDNSNLSDAAELFYTHQQYGTRTTFDNTYFASGFLEIYKPENTIRKHLVIFSSSIWETVNFLENDRLHSDFKDAYALIFRVLNEKVVTDKYKITVRWHPNLQNAGKFETLELMKIIESTPFIEHIEPASSIDSYSLLQSADVVITTGSTMGIEANYFKKPSILLGVALYMDLKVCYQPKNFSELLNLLSSELEPLDRFGAVVYGAFFASYGYEYKYFGINSAGYEWKGQSVALLLNKRNQVKNFVHKVLRFLFRKRSLS
jgi:hypothetical protein